MKNSLHKMFWRTLLVLACTLFASNAWADDGFNIYVNSNSGNNHIYTWITVNNENVPDHAWPGETLSVLSPETIHKYGQYLEAIPNIF